MIPVPRGLPCPCLLLFFLLLSGCSESESQPELSEPHLYVLDGGQSDGRETWRSLSSRGINGVTGELHDRRQAIPRPRRRGLWMRRR